ncbi:hypothetical protein BPLS_P0384 [Bathymodiolus platifrons methanotrophic gill symbiont]|uniref:hypothetical protein n=1 Tax=Bathymodiolus platifrons methanotrophic gill symbiont TaxID=113268 RepID=UPI00138052AC|nr:hypothetical protein [Bathymodiolus platifrons methanotrophic gill symbiont]TXL09982.1 hypothetical protein BMR08_11205 [Methylococcaceae bacterium CS2]GFO73997.1 hypothetical protein BPLS_P0384 [Bathymodiolus platifrons methanotrophic gill symbiont]
MITGAVEYSKGLGINSHKDYHSLKAIFGTKKLGICWSRYRYGKDKMPYYVKGPNESTADANNIVKTLEKSCGAGNFHFRLSCGESLFLRKLVLGIPAQASGKNLTRPLMPSAPQTSCVRATSPLPS